MSELRKIFTSKDYVINSNIVKCISKLDISLDEFLLIIYFINISCYLDNNDIKEKLGFDEEKVFNTFSSLLDKKYIEIQVINNNGNVEEKIKLDPLYDRLALNNETNKSNTDIFALFEKELGRALSSFEYEIINKWIENNISEDIIIGALKEAILNNVRNFKYIDKIVYNWSKNGVKASLKEEKEMFDYDWLDDNE